MAARLGLARLRSGPKDPVRGALRGLSLRVRLLLGLVLVAALGLLAADVVVYGSIRSYLNTQIDTELESATGASLRVACQGFGDGRVPRLPLDVAVELVSSTGAPLCAVPTGFHLASLPPLATLAGGSIFDAEASASAISGPYRVLPVSVTLQLVGPGSVTPGIALVAIPLLALEGTLHRLLLVELTVSLVVLVVLAGLGQVVVRVGLRPLVRIEETAEAIATGDLTRRVEEQDERTEVGRLGHSLNVMLTTIEQSFADQQASEARLRRFLADASHELRTPVTSIRGYAELFRRGAAERPDDLALAMRRIEDESIRMGGLVDDLLLLARLDQGRPLVRERVDLVELAMDAAADAQVLAPERPISLDAPTPVVVDGDEARLRQVIGNLVQNALRHTPEGTPITVAVTEADGTARLSVCDEGPGIDEEHAARLFERFYRADPSRTRGSGGSGLGLSIVASIARSHGGRAFVETEVGAGSTFVVELPLAVGGAIDLLEVGRVVEAAKDPPLGGDDEDGDGSVVGPDEGER